MNSEYLRGLVNKLEDINTVIKEDVELTKAHVEHPEDLVFHTGGAGAQQQQQTQNILNNQYQDYLNFQNYPYKHLGFMSDMLRGLPLTQQSSSIYAPPPSIGSQVAGLGAVAAGAALRAKGGTIEEKPAGLADLALSRMG